MLFRAGPRFKEAAALLGRAPPSALEALLRELPAPRSLRGLGLAPRDRHLVVDMSNYVLEQARFCGCTPDELVAFLGECGLPPAHAECFGAAWQRATASSAPEAASPLSSFRLGDPELQAVDWDLRVPLASDVEAQARSCAAATLRFQLQEEAFSLDFSRAELEAFFDQIEGVAASLDQAAL